MLRNLAIGLCMLALAACGGGFGAPKIDAQTPSEKLAVLTVEFTNAVATLNDLRDQGVIKDGSSVEEKTQAAVSSIRALIHQAQLAIANSEYSGFDAYMAAANAALLELLTIVENSNANSRIDQSGASRHADASHWFHLDAAPGAIPA